MNLRFLCFPLLIAFSSCKKSEQELPTPSKEGKNILACRVNGEVHVYSGKVDAFDANGVGYKPFQDKLFMDAYNTDFNDQIYITLPGSPDSLQTGVKYFFSDEIASPIAVYDIRMTGTNVKYKTGSGHIIFTRRDSNVAAGSFEFTGYNSSADSVVIKEGIFDISKI